MVYASICTNMPWSPGRLTTDPAKSGGYFVCKEDSFVNTNLRYLENHPDLNWRVVNANIVGTGTDVIKFISGSYSLAFGKVVGKFTNVGRVRFDFKSKIKFLIFDIFRFLLTLHQTTVFMAGIQLKMQHLNT